RLLVTGVERGASDFHLKAGAPPILRIHGRLMPQGDFGVITAEDMDGLARKMLAERWYNQLRDGKEIDSAYSVPNFGRFRVNMFLALGAVRAVFRAIPAKKPRFDELGLPPVLEHLAMERRGLVLCTGITGSGKSTTLAAMIDFINRNRNDHIITIEDPIEFTHEDINRVVSQRLIPRIGGEGRVPAVEVMIGTGMIRDCIREAKRTPEIPAAIAQGQSQYGMQTFDQCLLRLYREGLVSYETAREAASSPDDFD